MPPNRSVAHLTTEQLLRSDELLFFCFDHHRRGRVNVLRRQHVGVDIEREGHAAHSRGGAQSQA